MPPDDVKMGTPASWLRCARSDLAIATIASPPTDVLPNTLCYHAQQAAEKAIKAVLVFLQIDFPPTHNLNVLLELVSQRVDVPDFVRESVRLTPYSVSSRYPDDIEPVTDEAEYTEAITLAQTTFHWAQGVVAAQ